MLGTNVVPRCHVQLSHHRVFTFHVNDPAVRPLLLRCTFVDVEHEKGFLKKILQDELPRRTESTIDTSLVKTQCRGAGMSRTTRSQ